MAELTVYVVDTETCDRDGGRDGVVQLGVLPVRVPDVDAPCDAEVLWDEGQEDFCRPARPITFGSMGVHHVTEADVADALPLSAVLAGSRIGTDLPAVPVLCAHNAVFDRTFLDPHLAEMTWAADGREAYWVDTLRLARHVWPDLESHGNQALRYALGVAHPALLAGAHRALQDCLTTALILRRLLAERSLRDLCALQGRPIQVRRFKFGRHRGESIEDVPQDYLRWIVNKSDLDVDHKWSSEEELRRRRGAFVPVTSGLVREDERERDPAGV